MSLKRKILVLRDDVRAILINDPAARSLPEIVLYPGLHAIILHRVAHFLWQRNVPFIPRLISQISRFITGIEIHPGARIGRGFFIDHGMGVVIGETTEIGNWVVLHQGVTLGGTGKQRGKRHPTVKDNVVVGVGAIVLGAITLGKGSKIGGGAVVVKDVPAHATAVGIPARVVATRDPETGTTRRVEQLPDPEGQMLRSLRSKVLELEERLADLEMVSDLHDQMHQQQAPLSTTIWDALDDQSRRDEEYSYGSGI
jgi:serine O-acetyltransferase